MYVTIESVGVLQIFSEAASSYILGALDNPELVGDASIARESGKDIVHVGRVVGLQATISIPEAREGESVMHRQQHE